MILIMILTIDLEQVVSAYLKQKYKDFERPTNYKNRAFEKWYATIHSDLFYWND